MFILSSFQSAVSAVISFAKWTNAISILVLLLMLSGFSAQSQAEVVKVATARVPDDGFFPQAQVDGEGTLHLTYFKGEPMSGDVFYVRSKDGGATFSKPLRVNSQAGSVLVMGTIRGPQMAIGKRGRVHVAWMGTGKAQPRFKGQTPMLYARMNDTDDAFEPQRNVIQAHPGLDGGGSVAADQEGNVYVAWHAPNVEETEADRQVWLTRSKHLLVSSNYGATFALAAKDPWKIGQCVMSTSAIASSGKSIVAAWETEQQIKIISSAIADAGKARPIVAPGEAKGRKHPALAINSDGAYVVAWTEGTGWQKGGSLAWQLFDAKGKPDGAGVGKAKGVPIWSVPAVVAFPDKTFCVIF